MGIRFFFIFILLLIPPAMAQTDTLSLEYCNQLGLDCPDPEVFEILTDEEKKKILLDLIVSKDYPDYHDQITSWNEKLDVTTKPEEIEVSSARYIQDAWVKIMSVSPAVYTESKVYVPKDTNAYIGTGYRFQKPSDYHSADRWCGWGPRNEFDDCRTIFGGSSDQSKLYVYQDGELISNGKKVPIRIDDHSTEIRATLQIAQQVEAAHYRWHKTRDCCRYWYKNGLKLCARSYHECKIDNHHPVTYRHTVNDVVVLRNDSNAIPEINLISEEKGALNTQYFASIDQNDAVGFVLDIGDTHVQKNIRKMNVTWLYPPYNFLQVHAKDDPEYFHDELSFVRGDQKVGSANVLSFDTYNVQDSCEFTTITYFDTSQYSCETQPNLAKIELSANKLRYKSDEEAEITISVYDIEETLSTEKVFFDHDGVITEVEVVETATVAFQVNPGLNVITASFNTGVGTVEKEVRFSAGSGLIKPVAITLISFALVVLLLLKAYNYVSKGVK